MTGAAESRNAGWRWTAALWLGLLGGPAAWFLHLLVSYSLVRWVCRSGGMWVMHAATVAALAGAAAVGGLAWRNWRRAGRPRGTDGAGAEGRSRFLSIAGVALAAYSVVLIAVEGIPNFVLPPCP